MNRDPPDPSEVLTVSDVDELPNGTATIVRVAGPQHREIYTATIDGRGYVRSLSRDRHYFPREPFEVIEP